jgi:hypothetical protein
MKPYAEHLFEVNGFAEIAAAQNMEWVWLRERVRRGGHGAAGEGWVEADADGHADGELVVRAVDDVDHQADALVEVDQR